jgi:GxxExxY protein
MPIECGFKLERIGQEQFHALDRDVMRHVFDIHNSIGRFCDERIYQEELARRCCAMGLSVEREAHLKVIYRDFSKSYYMDMLIERGGLYELKAVAGLDDSHEKQTINYLLLASLKHGKLVNMRPSSVEYHFVSTTLNHEDRREFQLITERFSEETSDDQSFRKILAALLGDWGAFLDANLYREAMLHFFDGLDIGLQPIDIVVDGQIVGAQKMCVLDDETVWHMSAIRNHSASYETHLLRLLGHTKFRRIHWVNLDQRIISLRTLIK